MSSHLPGCFENKPDSKLSVATLSCSVSAERYDPTPTAWVRSSRERSLVYVLRNSITSITHSLSRDLSLCA